MKNLGIYSALALSAAAAMIYQVVAMNYLFFYFTQNSYSVSLVISVFLLGLGVGGYSIYKLKKHDVKTFIGLQAFIALYAVLVFANLDKILLAIPTNNLLFISALLLLPPTIALGAIFPLATRMAKANEEVGLAYAIDLGGAVLGTLLAGFLLIPYLGNNTAAIVGAILNLVTIVFLTQKKVLWTTITIPAIVLLIVFSTPITIADNERTYTNTSAIGDITFYHGEGLRFEKQSAYGKISVKDNSLFINNRLQCTLQMGRGERELPEISLKHFNTKNIDLANIGLGCGETAAETLLLTNKTLDVIEINPVVIQANKELTNLQENTRVNVITQEGLEYFRNNKKRYDAILIDIENPAIIHASNLYTKEAFETLFDSLSEQGVLGLWTYHCREKEYFDILHNTLKSVFPYVYYVDEIIMIASKKELSYKEYNSSGSQINTLDEKALSTFYFSHCVDWSLIDERFIQ